MAIAIRSHHDDSAQSTLELALTLPLFVALILGTAEIANIAWAAIQVTSAARAGAQFGSLSRTNAADTLDIQAAAKNDQPSLSGLTVTPINSCTCVDSSGSPTAIPNCAAALTSCASPSVIEVSVQVNTTAAITPIVHFPFLPASYTLHGQAIVGVEQ